MPLYSCPYTVGAEFVLVVSSPPCAHLIRAKVPELYTFTRSQTMKIAILAKPEESDLPSIAFLKLYDRRYLDERMRHDAYEPWDHEREAEAQRIAQNIQPRHDPHRVAADNAFPWNDPECSDTDEEDYEEELKSMGDSDSAIEQWLIEKRFRCETRLWFRTECKAYHHLQTLQGYCIPKFYGATAFDETWQVPPGIDTEVRGILLEFIEGISLEEVNIQASFALNNPHIGQAAVNCYKRIISLGVVHGDVRLANIMVRNDGRVFLLDFALAMFRKDRSEDDWNKFVALEDELF